MIDAQRHKRIGRGSGAWSAVIPLLALQFLSGIWYMPQLSFFPIYLQETLGFAPVVIAAFVAAGQLAGMVAGLLGGSLSDSRGSKWVLVLGLIFAAIATFTFRVSQPWLIGLLWVIGGLAVGFHTTGGQSYVTRVADVRSLGLASALYALCLTMGGAAGNPLSGRVLDTRGFATFGLMLLGLAVATLVGAVVLLPPVSAERTGVSADGIEQRTERLTGVAPARQGADAGGHPLLADSILCHAGGVDPAVDQRGGRE